MKPDLARDLGFHIERGVNVLVASGRPSHKLKYVDQLVAALESDIEVRFQPVLRTLTDVDVVHLVEPSDAFFRLGPTSKPRERLKRIEGFVELLSKNRVALLRTVYGSVPQWTDPLDKAAADLLDSVTTRFITVDRASKTPDRKRTLIVPHPELTDRFTGYPTKDKVMGRLLCVTSDATGSLAQSALKTFPFTRTPDVSLRLIGVANELIKAELAGGRTRISDKISTRTGELSDAALIEEISAAEFVLAPEPTTLAEYQFIVMALTFRRPVIVPGNQMLLALREEVGAPWIVPLDSPVTAERLDLAIGEASQAEATLGPNMSGRGWMHTAQRYAQIYRNTAFELRATVDEQNSVPGTVAPVERHNDIDGSRLISA